MQPEAARVSISANPEAPRAARRLVRAFLDEHCGGSDRAGDAVALAVTEAVSNAVVHAYPGSAGAIDVAVEVAGEVLTVTIRDHGAGVRADWDGRRPRSLGFELMRQSSLARSVVRDPEGGTLVTMRFPCPPRRR